MTIKLYYTASDNNQLTKVIELTQTLTGALRNESDIVRPQILIECESVSDSNYAYIPEFHRYYFIREVESIRNGLWLIQLESDPLMSFRTSIAQLEVILQESETSNIDDYLADSRVWITKVKDKTSIIQFPSGLSETGDFILITAGGNVNV